MVAASARCAIGFSLSPGQAHDAVEGRALLDSLQLPLGCHLIMDRAYEGDNTRQLALNFGLIPSYRRRATASSRGDIGKPCIAVAMRSSGCFEGSRAFAGSSADSKNWISCSSPSSISR